MALELLSFVPLITVLVGMGAVSLTCKSNDFDCTDIWQDIFDCDVCWFDEKDRVGCFCCTVLYDDSSEEFHAYAKKS